MKAIIPIAGLGTRLMPLTLHQPKALVGIVDRPMIHYVIEEVDTLGIEEMVFVISPQQTSIKKYINLMGLHERTRFVIQREPIGNADAIFQALPWLGKEPACVFFCDDILAPAKPIMEKAVRLSEEKSAPILILERVPMALVSKYGIVKVRKQKGGFCRVLDIVEKPLPEKAPSNLSVVGRYVLTPAVFETIKKLYSQRFSVMAKKEKEICKAEKEVGITDALRLYLKEGGEVYGLEFKGERFDCGSKLGLMKAQIYFGLKHEEFGKRLNAYARRLL